MNLDERQILINDLCSRLPYGIIVHIIRNNKTEQLSCIDATSQEVWLIDASSFVDIDEIKPYLRPLSSMTEKECEEVGKHITIYDTVDWMNKHHFDYHGLIEKGLAIEAPDGMYKTE